MAFSPRALAERPAAALVAAALLAGLLASCSSTAGGRGGGLFSRPAATADSSGGTVTVGNEQFDVGMFLKSGYCPPVEIRNGGESLITYERGHEGDPAFIAFQGTIGRTARECAAAGPDSLTIKVGVAGRVVAGPTGRPANVTLPLRISVVKQHGGDVLYSQVFRFPATVTPPEFAADFAQVIDGVGITVGPADRDLIVLVGFDDGKPPGAGVTG
jgi:hypothetical protein